MINYYLPMASEFNTQALRKIRENYVSYSNKNPIKIQLFLSFILFIKNNTCNKVLTFNFLYLCIINYFNLLIHLNSFKIYRFRPYFLSPVNNVNFLCMLRKQEGILCRTVRSPDNSNSLLPIKESITKSAIAHPFILKLITSRNFKLSQFCSCFKKNCLLFIIFLIILNL